MRKLIRTHAVECRVAPPRGGPCFARRGGAVPRAAIAKTHAALAAAKAQMDPDAGDPRLGQALRAADIYAPLRRRIRGSAAVTNAWLKMYEMATRFDWGARLATGGRLRVFLNAELPGAFVCALGHYMAARHPRVAYEWAAASLWPEAGAAALGDTYGVLARHPDRWVTGPALRGDLTSAADVDALAAAARRRLGGAADLYTSDVGVDVGGEYARQEELVARAHLGQVLTAFLVLRPGGGMVVKTYTFALEFSQSLIAVCAAAFADLRVVKPATSRSANSEVYLVGHGFRGADTGLLRRALRDFDVGRPLVPLPARTLRSLAAAAQRVFGDVQIPHIAEALRYYRAHRHDIPALRKKIEAASGRARREWLRRHGLAS
jgi:hypothetical protein